MFDYEGSPKDPIFPSDVEHTQHSMYTNWLNYVESVVNYDIIDFLGE